MIYGDGSSTRDYIHVNDLAKGIKSSIDILISNSPSKTQTYHLANSAEISLVNLLAILTDKLHLSPSVQYLPFRKGEVSHNFASTSLAKSDLNFNPDISFEDGILDLYQWILREEF